MSHENTIRAWKDPTYQANLSEEDILALLPNPSGDLIPIRQSDGALMDTPDCSVGMSHWCGCPRG